MSKEVRQPQRGAAKTTPARIDIAAFLAADCVTIDVRATDKARLLLDLARRAVAMLDVPEATIAEALTRREAIGSTGTGDGIALPHARLAEIKKPFGMLVRLRKAIEFESVDGKPVDLVFLLLIPAVAHGEPVNALACAARALRQPDVLKRLRAAQSATEVYAVVTSAGRR